MCFFVTWHRKQVQIAVKLKRSKRHKPKMLWEVFFAATSWCLSLQSRVWTKLFRRSVRSSPSLNKLTIHAGYWRFDYWLGHASVPLRPRFVSGAELRKVLLGTNRFFADLGWPIGAVLVRPKYTTCTNQTPNWDLGLLQYGVLQLSLEHTKTWKKAIDIPRTIEEKQCSWGNRGIWETFSGKAFCRCLSLVVAFSGCL